MLTVALFARLEAKPGKEAELAAFLEQGLALANQETTTPVWFALRLGEYTRAGSPKLAFSKSFSGSRMVAS